ncbi:COG1470 family protein [Halococcus thailandensis]|uniref:DUF4352 domain-containing protein n=1 Tax=Halococcus thailandensis JCM 13552 TaxID=1227457 RepID=M0NCU8_9EURY|nr:hypothetical protein [Halococcus thailandensis]EMA55807.1 hypothetical protein C451_04988 [Halococcus thailandensis JCM 13552]
MERRMFLRAGGLGAAALFAGCSSNSGDNNSSGSGNNSTEAGANEPETTQSGPAQFSNVTVQGPTNVTAGEEFSIPVSVANTGGENGTYSDTLTVAEGSESFNKSVTIEGVQPGATANTSVGPLNISSVDNYTLAVKGTNTTHQIQVNPVEKQPGKSLTVNNLKLSVDSIRLTPSMFYTIDMGGFNSNKTGTGLISAGSKKVLCAIRISLENVGTNQATFSIGGGNKGLYASNSSPTATLMLPKGSFYTDLPDGGNLNRIEGLNGNPMMNAQLNSGESKSGWLLAQLPRSAATGTVEIGYQADSKNTPPETIWPFPPKNGQQRSLPEFKLNAIRAPGSVQLGKGGSYEISVTNIGSAPGTYRGITQFKGPDDNEWTSYNKQKAKIKPGKSNTFKQKLGYPSDPQLGEVKLRIRPFDKTTSVTFETAKLNFGKTYSAPVGREITISDVQTASSYTRASSDEPETPEQGQQYLFARVDVNTVEQDAGVVYRHDLVLMSDGSSYDPSSDYADKFSGPVQANHFPRSVSGSKGTSKSGYIFYKVPSGVTPSNATITWSPDKESPWVQWQQG